jgi:translation initiation factor IF-1
MAGDFIEVEGAVDSSHPGDLYSVTIEIGGQSGRLLAKRSGRLNSCFIRVLPGDRVLVAISPYDLKRGRIIQRLDPGRKPRN